MKSIYRYSIILSFIGFVLLQTILSGLVDFGPLLFVSIYPLFLITIPLNVSLNRLMILAFVIGLTIDFFSNSIMGLNSAASIIMVVAQPKILKLLHRKGEIENQIRPGMRELGFNRFFAYLAINLIIHHTAITLIENFGFSNFQIILPRIVVSLLVNMLLILVLEYGVFFKNRE